MSVYVSFFFYKKGKVTSHQFKKKGKADFPSYTRGEKNVSHLSKNFFSYWSDSLSDGITKGLYKVILYHSVLNQYYKSLTYSDKL